MVHEAEALNEGVQQGRILAELEAIFQTAEFERAPVMRRLLAFLVRTTLAGGGDDLKAYSVAVDGLGRDADFDSQSDSYPRVQVGRLRKMLDVYYAQTPAKDDIRLLIKPGGYRVYFRKIDASTLTEQPHDDTRSEAERPAPRADLPALPTTSASKPSKSPGHWIRVTLISTIIALAVAASIWLGAGHLVSLTAPQLTRAPILAVRPITHSDDAEARILAQRVTLLLGDALNRSWVVQLAASPDGSDAPSPDADYILSGQVTAGPGYAGRRLSLRLASRDPQTQIWNESILLPDDNTASLFTALRQPIANIIAPTGAIATDQRARHRGANEAGYACLLNAERYFRDLDPTLQRVIRSCIEETIARDPMNATALAAAAHLEFNQMLGTLKGDFPTEGAQLARRAVIANPQSADAHTADARAAFIFGQCERGKESAGRAIKLNPFDAGILGLLGYLSYQCDDPESVDMLLVARALESDFPPPYTIALMLGLIDRGDGAEAVRIAGTVRPAADKSTGPLLIARTIASAVTGDRATGQSSWDMLVRERKVKSDVPDSVLSQYILSSRLRAKVLAYLAQQQILPAGVVPDA